MVQEQFDDTYDIIVVGYGYSGGIAAIEAHDAGARVLLVDKMQFPGGISVCSYGAMRSAHNAGQAFKYLKARMEGAPPSQYCVPWPQVCHKLSLTCENSPK